MSKGLEKYRGTVPTPADDRQILDGLKYHSGDSRVTDLDAWGRVIVDLEEMIKDEQLGEGIYANSSNFRRIVERWFGITGRKRRFEATHTLGTQPSIVSSSGWRVYHPAIDEATHYEATDQVLIKPFSTFEFGKTESAQYFGESRKGGYTNIYPEIYRDSSGSRRALLVVCRGYESMMLNYRRKPLERKLLRNMPSPEVDSRFVIFEQPQQGKQLVSRISMAADSDMFELTTYKVANG